MEAARVIAVLNELLGLEQCCLASRLLESTVFVSDVSFDVDAMVHGLAGAALQHRKSLAGEIIRLGGAPGPRVGDLASGDLHFLELRGLLPRLVREQERMVSAYTSAATSLVAEPQAAQLASSILADHENALERLKVCRDRKVDAVG